VRLYLPRVGGYAAEIAEPPAGEAPRQSTMGEMVLVVEDDPGVLEMAVESLVELGYGVETAISGPDALERIRAGGRIDLLFSDIVMPDGMNGVELALKAREIRPGLKILLTSGYAAGALADAETLPSDVEIIGKPYRLEDLAQKLRKVIDGD
jgi:CheY-like chemotaxis protein